MPMMDLSVVLTNPYTLDKFSVLRQIEEVNDFGETVTCQKVLSPKYGVVSPAAKNELARQVEEEHQTKSIEIITKFMLHGPASGYQPDIVLWPITATDINPVRPNSYMVKHVGDFSQYGPGFMVVTCESIDTIDNIPQPQLTVNDE